MANDLFIPQGLHPLAQGKKMRASASVFATLGDSDIFPIVRVGGVEFKQTQPRTKSFPANFGLDHIPSTLGASCSADATPNSFKQGGGELRGAYSVLSWAKFRNPFRILELCERERSTLLASS